MFGQKNAVFNHVVNLTKHHVGFYDNSGNIVSFRPGCSVELLKKLSPNTMVIVENEADALAYNIPPENIVVVFAIGIGRHGARISRLIRPEDEAAVTYTPPIYCP